MTPSRSLLSVVDMLKFNAGSFFRATAFFGLMRGSVVAMKAKFGDDVMHQPVADELRKSTLDQLQTLLSDLEKLDARHTKTATERLVKALSVAALPTLLSFDSMIGEIDSRLDDELSAIYLFCLGSRDADFFNTEHFGQDVAAKFPTGLGYEIAEASKCLAFDRSTAAVFHLMRCMEIGLSAVRKCLSLPDPKRPAERNWGIVLNAIKDNIDQRKWNAEEDKTYFHTVYASLDAVKNAWRNPTMHVESKYTKDEAEAIYGAVKGYFQRIAARMNEDGLPLV